MSPPLTTDDPPPRFPTLAGATWTRARNPHAVVTVNGEEMWQVFAVNEEIGLAAAFVTDGEGRYVLDAPGRYRIRRLHGVVTVRS